MAAALVAVAALSGCGPAQLSLKIRPDDELNNQRPTYVLVRNVDSKAYLEESYQAVAAKVMAPDDSVLQKAIVFPGTPQEIKITLPAKGQVGLYVFFYRPNGEWKALLPLEAKSYEVKLEGSRLRVEKK